MNIGVRCVHVSFVFLFMMLQAEALTITGRVVGSPAGNGVSGITVVCEHHENRNASRPDDFKIEVKTGDDGSFKIQTETSKSQYMVLVTDPAGNVLAGRTHVSKDLDLGEISASLPCSLTGRLLDPSGEPLGKAEVNLLYKFPELSCTHYVKGPSVVTDEQGNFEFTSLIEGEYNVQAKFSPFAPGTMDIKVTDGFNYVEIILEQGAIVEGRVTDLEGKPVSGVEISGQRGETKVLSGADGTYRMEGLKPGSVHLEVESDKYVLELDDSMEVQAIAGKASKADIRLVEAGQLELKFISSKPSVKLPEDIDAVFTSSSRRGSKGNRYFYRSVSIDREGLAVLKGVPPGEFDVRFRSDSMQQESISVKMEAGGFVSTNLVVREMFSVAGVVKDHEGAVVEGARIQLFSADDRGRDELYDYRRALKRASTEADGSYVIKGLPAGKYEIECKSGVLLPAKILIETGEGKDASGDIVLQAGNVISGIVLDSDNKPVEGVLVSITVPRQAGAGRYSREFDPGEPVATDAAGKFKIPGLADGVYDLVFHADGESVSKLMSVKAGVDDVMVVLGRKHKVVVRVKDIDDKFVEGASISWSRKGGSDTSVYTRELQSGEGQHLTDTGGVFQVALMTGYDYQVHADAEGHLPGVSNIELVSIDDSALPVEVVVRLGKGGTVTGLITDAAGRPMEGLKIYIADPGAMQGERYLLQDLMDDEDLVATGKDGRYVVSNVPPGVAAVHVLKQSAGGSPRVLAEGNHVIYANKPHIVNLVVGEKGSVKGVLRDKSGNPAGEDSVYLIRAKSTGQGDSIETGEDGMFVFEDVHPGDYYLFARYSDDDSSSGVVFIPVKVIAGESIEVELKQADNDGFKVSGMVFKNGEPVINAGLIFRLHPKSGAMDDTARFMMPIKTSTDENGRFSAVGMKEGDYIVSVNDKKGETVSRSGGGSGVSGFVGIDGASDDLLINLSVTDLKIIVSDAAGEPVSDALLTVAPDVDSMMLMRMLSNRAVSSEQPGVYTVSSLSEGDYLIYAYNEEDLLFKTVKVNKGMDAVEIRFGASFSISGNVDLLPGGSSDGTGIMVVHKATSRPVDFSTVKDGAYKTARKLPPDEYLLFALRNGYAVGAHEVNLVRDGSIGFGLSPGGDLNITVVDNASRGVPGRTVRLVNEKGRIVNRISGSRLSGSRMQFLGDPWDFPFIGRTDSDGVIFIRGLWAGEYKIEVEGSDKSGKVQVKELETSSLTISL